MEKRSYVYPSADGKTLINCVEWVPDDEKVVGVLQIAHGITEYIERYEWIAKYFTERGYSVIGNDHLGHGESVDADGYKMYFGKAGSWYYAVQDIRSCRVLAGALHPRTPLCMLGFSLGSFLVRDYLIQFPGTVDAAVLVGTGMQPSIMLALGRLIAAMEGRKAGEEHSTPLIMSMMFDNYNQHFHPTKTGWDWLNSNEKALDAYINDPLRGKEVSCGLFRELLDGMMVTGSRHNMKLMDKQTPILLLSGKDDAVGDFGKGVERVYRAFKRAGCEDVTMQLFSGRHDILREECGEEVIWFIRYWMLDKMSED